MGCGLTKYNDDLLLLLLYHFSLEERKEPKTKVSEFGLADLS